MLKLFQGKNGGAISTMLALMMVAILGISSVLVELGRYRSASALFDEAVHSSGFSTIASKDEALLKNYGLLAMSQDVDVNAVAEKYVKGNLGGSSSTTFNVETLIHQIDSVAAEGIYSLNEAEVLKRQILEISKYRGPISLIEDTIDLDALLSSLSGAFSGLDAIGSFVGKMSEVIDKLIQTLTHIKNVAEKTSELYESKQDYKKKYDNLIDLLKKRDELTDGDADKVREEPVEPDKEDEKFKNEAGEFQEELFQDAEEEYKKAKEAYEKWEKKHKELVEVIEKIDGKEGEEGAKAKYIKAIHAFQNSYNEFMRAANDISEDVGDLLGSGLDKCYDKLISDVKNSKQDEETKKELIAQYEKEKDSLGETAGGLSKLCEKIHNARDIIARVDVQEELNYLNGHTSADLDKKELKKIHNSVSIVALINNLVDRLKSQVWSTLIDKIVKFVETLIDDIGKLLRVLSCVSGEGMFCDPVYCVEINDATWNLMEENKSNRGNSISSHENEDKQKKQNRIQDATEVANELGYDLNKVNGNGTDSMTLALNEQMNNLTEGIQKVTEAAGVVKGNTVNKASIGKVVLDALGVGKIRSVISIITNIKSFIGGMTQIVTSLFSIAAIITQHLVEIIYDNALINTYATKMFRNRTSKDDDETMLGVPFSDIARGSSNAGIRGGVAKWLNKTPSFSFLQSTSIGSVNDYAFAGAEAEYIYAGKRSEIQNQKTVSMSILMIRMLANVSAVFTNKTAIECAEAVGPFAPVVLILFWLGETGLDMLFLSNGVAVPLVKIGKMCFLSEEGLDKLSEKIKDLIDSVGESVGQEKLFKKVSEAVVDSNDNIEVKKNTETNKKEVIYKGARDSLQNTLDNLIEFDYTEHLWLLLCFVSSKQKVTRIGDLIQMEMNAADKNNNFKLSKAFTYVRVEGNVKFQTLIPIAGIKDKIPLQSTEYVGY